MGFGLADMVVGHVDRLPFYVRTGTFDAFLLRPLSALGQLVTSDFSLRRLGRIGSGVVVLVIALAGADVDWTPARALLVVVTPLAGGVIFGAVFVATCTIGFHVVEGMEFANAFTYGGNYLSSFPFNIFGTFIRRFFTFVVPAAFVAYLPTLALLRYQLSGSVGDQNGEIWSRGLPASWVMMVFLTSTVLWRSQSTR